MMGGWPRNKRREWDASRSSRSDLRRGLAGGDQGEDEEEEMGRKSEREDKNRVKKEEGPATSEKPPLSYFSWFSFQFGFRLEKRYRFPFFNST